MQRVLVCCLYVGQSCVLDGVEWTDFSLPALSYPGLSLHVGLCTRVYVPLVLRRSPWRGGRCAGNRPYAHPRSGSTGHTYHASNSTCRPSDRMAQHMMRSRRTQTKASTQRADLIGVGHCRVSRVWQLGWSVGAGEGCESSYPSSQHNADILIFNSK
jgi:hypothetical protein